MDLEERSVPGSRLKQNEKRFEVIVATDYGGWNTTTNRVFACHLASSEKLRVRAFVPESHPRRAELAKKIELLKDKNLPGESPVDLLDYSPDRLQHVDFLIMHCYGRDLERLAEEFCKIKKCKWIPVVHRDWGEFTKFFEETEVSFVGRESNHEDERQRQMEMCKKADLVVTIGPKVAEPFKNALQSYVISITPGVFSELNDVRRIRGDGETFNVLINAAYPYLPPFFYIRGCDIAVKAILSLQHLDQDMPYHLIFVMKSSHGVSELKQTLLQQGMQSNQFTVESTPDDAPENLAKFISDADVLILPSRVEGFGMSGIYAISAALPVLISGHSGVGTAVKKLRSGGKHVVDSDDPQVWAQKIKEVRTMGQEKAYLEAEQLRKEYMDEFSWEDQCNEIVEKMMMTNGKLVEKMTMKNEVPSEINLRGRLALEAYNKALTKGKARVKRVPIMLIGQDYSGKTSLKNSLLGKPFNPDEDSTVGIDVDPSHFKVTTQIWKAGESSGNAQGTDAVEAMSFEHHTARLVAEHLKEEKKNVHEVGSMKVMKSGSSDVSSLSNSALLSSPSIDTSRSSTEFIDDRKRVPDASSDPTLRRKEHPPLASRKIPDEVATLIKKLLQEVEKVSDEEDIYSVLWDFGGQNVYYATHPLFITARAMYLLVFDLSRDPHERAKPVVKQGMYKKILDSHGAKVNLDYLNFWMTSVASLGAPNEYQDEWLDFVDVNIPPVFLVCTHADKPYDGADPFALAREVLGSLQTKPYKSQLYDDVFVVDNTKSGVESECSEVKRLREQVLAVAKKLPQMKEAIPIKWLKFEKTLQVTLKEGHKWISLEMAKQIASEVCTIDDEQEFLTLLNFLHDQRILIHFDDTSVLNHLVVLDPQWLVDVFKKVITVKPCDHEREFKDLWCRLESTGILDERLLKHEWSPLLDQQETCASLIEIMEKFSLLCPWPSSDASCGRQYLVPSMLMTHPPQGIIELVSSAQIPSLFLRFKSGQVPPGLFPRLMLQFFQWGDDEFWSPENPQLYLNFARFYTSGDEDCSVILLCHSSSIEVVVHRANLSADPAEHLSTKLKMSADVHYDAFEVACARAVRRKLALMLESMRKEFCWLKNMKYEEGFICSICCQGRAVKYCCTHHKQCCEKEECLHFWSESDLHSAKQFIRCRRCATAKINKVHVKQFAPWINTDDKLLTTDERVGRLLAPEGENDDKLLALHSKALQSLFSQSSDPKEVVLQLKHCMQLDQASLEQPDLETKRLIRCLATKAKQSNRLDVIKQLREITPAGTTGPLLPERLDIRNIPVRQMRDLTVELSSGEEWKVVAEELGLTPREIRFLDKRTLNPCDAALAFISRHCYISVGDLYDGLNKCGLPVTADLL